ncbi:hypothetical protein BDK51DRAFT_42252, partial [Blyttiomyces helicus]
MALAKGRKKKQWSHAPILRRQASPFRDLETRTLSQPKPPVYLTGPDAMGIPKLTTWLKEEFPTAFKKLNVMYAMGSRERRTSKRAMCTVFPGAAGQNIYRTLEILYDIKANKTVHLAVDGSTPLAKLHVQRNGGESRNCREGVCRVGASSPVPSLWTGNVVSITDYDELNDDDALALLSCESLQEWGPIAAAVPAFVNPQDCTTFSTTAFSSAVHERFPTRDPLAMCLDMTCIILTLAGSDYFPALRACLKSPAFAAGWEIYVSTIAKKVSCGRYIIAKNGRNLSINYTVLRDYISTLLSLRRRVLPEAANRQSSGTEVVDVGSYVAILLWGMPLPAVVAGALALAAKHDSFFAPKFAPLVPHAITRSILLPVTLLRRFAGSTKTLRHQSRTRPVAEEEPRLKEGVSIAHDAPVAEDARLEARVADEARLACVAEDAPRKERSRLTEKAHVDEEARLLDGDVHPKETARLDHQPEVVAAAAYKALVIEFAENTEPPKRGHTECPASNRRDAISEDSAAAPCTSNDPAPNDMLSPRKKNKTEIKVIRLFAFPTAANLGPGERKRDNSSAPVVMSASLVAENRSVNRSALNAISPKAIEFRFRERRAAPPSSTTTKLGDSLLDAVRISTIKLAPGPRGGPCKVPAVAPLDLPWHPLSVKGAILAGKRQRTTYAEKGGGAPQGSQRLRILDDLYGRGSDRWVDDGREETIRRP